ncbi:craniofacial development protein 2-like [Rhizophagus clarus]|uniref:Craniofacial development protein 2-like n=1 Tax=Rhizophagus clarus TaxID=94130 RepID=A0A8H3QJD3_9GLOM|nr:craniofacial development protein 2-like [Rhizophagus clarus]
MLHTQRTLVQKVDQAISGLQGMIEGALQNFLGFATSSTTEQQFIPLEDNEEYLSTDNEEEADKQKNSLKYVPQTQKINFKIATLNIQTINQEKIVDVMEYMTSNNIDILGLAETNVNRNTLKILEHTVQDKFKLYFTTEEKKGTGIRFLVKKEFAIYIQQFQHFEGHIGFIDFYTKKKKIHIVQAYINVQDKEKSQVKRLYKYIEH